MARGLRNSAAANHAFGETPDARSPRRAPRRDRKRLRPRRVGRLALDLARTEASGGDRVLELNPEIQIAPVAPQKMGACLECPSSPAGKAPAGDACPALSRACGVWGCVCDSRGVSPVRASVCFRSLGRGSYDWSGSRSLGASAGASVADWGCQCWQRDGCRQGGGFACLRGWRTRGWKPHRIRLAQTSLSLAPFHWYMHEQQRGTVSSNSRSQTVLFQQYSANLSL